MHKINSIFGFLNNLIYDAMKNYFRTKKLNILAILAGLTYAFMVVNTFVNDWDDILIGFRDGWEAAGDNVNDTEFKPSRNFHLLLRTKNDVFSYPDSIVNLKDHAFLKTKNEKVVALNSFSSKAKYSGWHGFFIGVISMVVGITYFVIPFHFYKFIGWIKTNIIFERENIRLIRCLGIELLIVYFGNVLVNFLSYKSALSLFSFSEYEIQMHSMDAIWLLFGIIVLLVAEILSRAIALKEEQELTI